MSLGKKNDYFARRNLPLIFYQKGANLKPYQNEGVTDASDTFLSALDYTGLLAKSKKELFLADNSVFDLTKKRRVAYLDVSEYGYWGLMDEKYLVTYGCRSKEFKLFQWKRDSPDKIPVLDPDLVNHYTNLLKAYSLFNRGGF